MTEVQLELKRCLHCKVPGCKGACPLGNDLPEIISNVVSGNYARATEIVGHPFGGVCGYVCPHELQCVGGCVLGKKGNPVPTSLAEATAFEHAPYEIRKRNDKLSGRRVAVVGGGVSGVTFAVKCYECGADVTLYEGVALLSTLYRIPQFRLPKKLCDDIADGLNASDIKVVYETVDNAKLQSLLLSFDAVYVAVGQTIGRKLGVDGEEYVTQAYDFLDDKTGVAEDIVVVGGGNTAMDCARLNARRGGRSIIAYRRAIADMPCFAVELAEARADGVEFVTNVAPIKADKQSDGKLSVTFAKTVNEGRDKLIVTDELIVLRCDRLVAAAGNVKDLRLFGNEKTIVGNCGNLYVGGDCAGGRLVVDAVKQAVAAFDDVVAKLG